MPISILGLANRSDGSTEHHTLSIASLDDVELTAPIDVEVLITKLSHDIFRIDIKSKAEIWYECSRCLKRAVFGLPLEFTTTYCDDPSEDEWPIVNNMIDVSEPLRQELLLQVPSQLFCEIDCKGIEIQN